MATLFLDFDGTITERDMLDAVAQTFGDPSVYAEVDRALDEGTITLHEVLRRELEPVRAPLSEVVAWVVERAVVRPGLRQLVERARARGWRVVVLSSGFRELIVPVLEREGLGGLEVLANWLDPKPTGWEAHFRDRAPCPICGEPCKRAAVDAVRNGRPTVYVGDGISDRCAAEAADLVFARRALAAHLDAKGAPYEPFEDFHDVLAGLERRLT